MATAQNAGPGPFARAVSAEIRALMGKQRVTKMALSEAVGFSQHYLTRRLNDDLPFTLDDIERIAFALGADYQQLVRQPVRQVDSARGWVTKAEKNGAVKL